MNAPPFCRAPSLGLWIWCPSRGARPMNYRPHVSLSNFSTLFATKKPQFPADTLKGRHAGSSFQKTRHVPVVFGLFEEFLTKEFSLTASSALGVWGSEPADSQECLVHPRKPYGFPRMAVIPILDTQNGILFRTGQTDVFLEGFHYGEFTAD